jgi:hypothetical protein
VIADAVSGVLVEQWRPVRAGPAKSRIAVCHGAGLALTSDTIFPTLYPKARFVLNQQ